MIPKEGTYTVPEVPQGHIIREQWFFKDKLFGIVTQQYENFYLFGIKNDKAVQVREGKSPLEFKVVWDKIPKGSD